MTAALLDRATTRPPANRQTRRPSRPALRVLDQVASRRRARHRSALLILFVAVLVGFFAVAFVHAELVAGQHDLDAVRAEISQAEAKHAELARAVEEASAPGVIVTRATELGMVRVRQPVYLTAAAPVHAIEVGPALVTPATTGGAIDGSSIVPVAAAAGTASAEAGDGDRLEGTLGVAGGISVAVRLPAAASSVAMGDPAESDSPVGTTTATGQPVDGSTPTVPVAASAEAEATARAVTASAPVSSIAGTRAVSSPVAGATATPVSAVTTIGNDAAGGLASAAATTSG